MQKERGSSRSLSLHQEIEREAREIEKEIERHPELDDIQVTDEMDAALLERIRDYEEELEEEREAVKKVEENLRNGHYSTAAESRSHAGDPTASGHAARHFRVPGDSVEFSAELMPEISRGFGLCGRAAWNARDNGSVGETAAGNGNRVNTAAPENMEIAGAVVTESETSGKATEGAAESTGEGKVLYRKKKRKYFVISLAAVLVIVMGVGVTTVGSKSHWKVLWERVTGGKTMNVINTEDMDSHETEDVDEVDAYNEITEKLNINPIRIRYRPNDMSLVRYEIQEEMLKADLLYEYKDEIIRYSLYMNDEDSSFGQNEEDNKIDEYTISIKEIEIKAEEFEVVDGSENRQIANFEYQGMHYQLKGIMKKSEFKKILENLQIL